MKILAIGSIAYDNILHYEGNLKDSIEKETLNWKINMSVRSSAYSRELWWTGLNIAYNLALLNTESVLIWAIWKDFKFTKFIQETVNLSYIYESNLLPSSNSFITVDDHWNQISIFSPWAMLKSDHIRVDNIPENISYAIISPTAKDAMFNYLQWLKEEWVKIFFDPGQQLSIMTKNDLDTAMNDADYLIVNHHEFTLFKEISWYSDNEIYDAFDKVIVTYWKDWSKIIDPVSVVDIPAILSDDVIDPTWVWEAYRAWIIKWVSSGLSWEVSWKIGALLASFCIESQGAQNHFIDTKQFQNLFLEEFGEEIVL